MPNSFTPEQIAEILEEFFNTVGTRQYIGARYVPIFGRKGEDSIEWDNEGTYEPLSIVLYQGNSYTSRQYVPVGVNITNQAFWALTGNYNAQVEQYRRETALAKETADNALEAANAAQNDINTLLPKSAFSEETTVKAYVDDAIVNVGQESQQYVDDAVADIEKEYRNTVRNSTVAPILFAGRLLDRYGYEDTAQRLHAQSVVYDNGYYYACGSFNNNAEQTVTKLDSNGRIVLSNSFAQLYHANSITAIEDYLVVASGDGLNLHLIDKTTLDYVRIITFTATGIENIFSICAEDNIIYMRCRDAAYNNYVYKTDVNVGDFTLVAALGKQEASVAQGFAYKDGIAYLMNNFRNIIYVYDTSDGALVNTYTLPDGDGLYPLGEPEDLFFLGDRLMFNAAEYYPINISSQASICFLFDAGITEPTNQKGNNPQADTYVNLTVDGNSATTFKPYNSFNTCEEAAIIADYRGSSYITLSNLSTGTLRVNRGSHFIVGSSATVAIKSILGTLASLKIRRVILDTLSCQYGDMVCHDVRAKSITLGFSRVTFNNLVIDDAGTIDATKCNLEYRGSLTLPDTATVTGKNASSKSMVDILVMGESKWAYKLLRSNGIDRAVIQGFFTGGILGGGITVSNYNSDTGFTANVSGNAQFTTLNYDNTGTLMFDSTAASGYPIHMVSV